MRTPLTDLPFFDDSHRALAADLESFAKNDLADIAGSDCHEGEKLDTTCKEIVARLGAAGFLKASCLVTEDERFDVRRLCLSREILARHDGLFDFAYAMQGLGTGPISLFGTNEQRRKYLVPVTQGQQLPAFALSEPEAGSDVGAMTTTATKDGNGYRLNGAKTWISNGGIADQYVVFARTPGSKGADGISAFIVEADTPGLSIAERIRVIAPHPLATIAMEDCLVPADAMVGAPGQGFAIAMQTLDVFRTTVGAAALGLGRRALDEALGRIHERHAFGKALKSFQITQTKIGEMALGLDAAALLVYRAAWKKDTRSSDPITREAAMAKLFATETAQKVIDEAVQLFGGMGVVSDQPVEVLYREIRALRIYEGTSEIQKLVIAKDVMGAYSAGG